MSAEDAAAALAAAPRRRLAGFPTPLSAAHRLSADLGGPDLYFKRDDLIGFGFGGNKVRGLEFLLADALRQKADLVVTGAGVQSNHVRATAAAATHAGLAMCAVYWGHPPEVPSGNHQLTRMLGADCHFTETDHRPSVDRHIDAIAAAHRRHGGRPYTIARGGACARGTLGHVAAARELAEQCRSRDLHPNTVVLAVGSGSTLAGWLLARAIWKLPFHVEGFTVSRSVAEAEAQVHRLAAQAAETLGVKFDIGPVVVHGGVVGPGYGHPTPEGSAAIERVARVEGIFLDPTYTGKAFAGLIDQIHAGRWGRRQTVVFVHTGGEPALFAW